MRSFIAQIRAHDRVHQHRRIVAIGSTCIGQEQSYRRTQNFTTEGVHGGFRNFPKGLYRARKFPSDIQGQSPGGDLGRSRPEA